MAAVCVRRVYTFRGEIVEFFEISVPAKGSMKKIVQRERTNEHYNLLLVCILERLGPFDGIFSLGHYRRATT